MKELVDQLKRNRTLSPEELRLLLTDASPEEREYLHRAAATAAFDAAIVWQNATV